MRASGESEDLCYQSVRDIPWFMAVAAKAEADLRATPARFRPSWANQFFASQEGDRDES